MPPTDPLHELNRVVGELSGSLNAVESYVKSVDTDVTALRGDMARGFEEARRNAEQLRLAMHDIHNMLNGLQPSIHSIIDEHRLMKPLVADWERSRDSLKRVARASKRDIAMVGGSGAGLGSLVTIIADNWDRIMKFFTGS